MTRQVLQRLRLWVPTYAEAPIGPGLALNALHAAMDEHASRQVATAIIKHIPKKLRELVDFEVGLQAGVFPILGALYYPHLGEDAIERQILADTQLVTGTGSHQRGVEHRHEVYAHLIRWMAAVKRLTVAGQKPSDINSRQGLQAAISRCNFDHEMAQFERDIRRDRKLWNTATVLEELKRHAQSWATGKADPKPTQPPQVQQSQFKQPQQNLQNPPGTKKLVKLAKAQSLALAAVAAKSGVPQTCYRWLSPAGCPNLSTCSFQHPPAQKGASHLLPACMDALKPGAGGVCPRLAVGIPCMFKHAAAALMGVGGVTVPSPTSTLETALMAFMQQTAAAAAVAAARSEASDARMTELLGVRPAIYHDCDDDMPADSSHDHDQNIALVRNDTSLDPLGVVHELENTESNLPVSLQPSCSSLLLHPNLLSHSEVLHPNPNVSAPLGSPKGFVAHLGTINTHEVKGTISDPELSLIPPSSNTPLQRARQRIRGQDRKVELGSSGITPEAITTLIALYALLNPILVGPEAESEILDDSSVLDSGSSVHTKGSKLTLGECNVTNLEIPYILGTAGDKDMHVYSTGTYIHSNHLKVEGAWACPWMDMSLISMSKLMQDGFTLIAEGVYCLAVSPLKQVYKFKINSSGLLALVPGVPQVLQVPTGVSSPTPYYPRDRLPISRADRALLTDDATPSPVTARAVSAVALLALGALIDLVIAAGVVHPSMHAALASASVKCGFPSLFGIICVLSRLYVSSSYIDMPVTGDVSPNPTLNLRKSALQEARAKLRATAKGLTPDAHGRRGHMPHDPSCGSCGQARFRRAMAKRTPDGHIVGGAEFGWVFGIDYAGPFEPDCDGYVWALFGVETGHTDMGFVELSPNKAGPDSLRGVKEMIREMHVMGPDPKPVARLHSDQDPSFNAELEAYLLTEKIAQTDTGGHRPENNSRTEKRIGLVTMAFKACLLEATGGTKYYEKLWGVGLKFANDAVNRSPRADGRPSP